MTGDGSLGYTVFQDEERAVDKHLLVFCGFSGIVGSLLKVVEKTQLPISAVEPQYIVSGVYFGLVLHPYWSSDILFVGVGKPFAAAKECQCALQQSILAPSMASA